MAEIKLAIASVISVWHELGPGGKYLRSVDIHLGCAIRPVDHNYQNTAKVACKDELTWVSASTPGSVQVPPASG